MNNAYYRLTYYLLRTLLVITCYENYTQWSLFFCWCLLFTYTCFTWKGA